MQKQYNILLRVCFFVISTNLFVQVKDAEASYFARTTKKNNAAIVAARLKQTNPQAAAQVKEMKKNQDEQAKQLRKKEELEEDFGGLDIVKAYINAKNSYEVASKNNPLTVFFAGSEKKAVRTLYEQAQAALIAPKQAYKNWLAMVEVTDQDYAQVKSYVQMEVSTVQKSYDQAKKENPTFISPFASSNTKERLEAKRALYEKVTIELATIQAILKDLNKKK